MQTETLRIAKPPKQPRQNPKRKRWKPGWMVRIVMAVAIIAAVSWYVFPAAIDQVREVSTPTRAMVTTDDVNLRAGPGTFYDVLAVIPVGTEVSVETETAPGFVRVAFQGQRGWMANDYLASPNNEVAQVEQVQAAEVVPSQAVKTQESEAPTEPPVVQPTAVPTYAPVIAESTQVQDDGQPGAPQPGEKWIEVNRTTRTVTLHNGDIVVARFDALIGKDLSPDGYYSTATGTFYVHVKEKALVETPFAEGVFLTDFVGFDPHRSNGFHSPVRDAAGSIVDTGGTTTLGCVRLAEDDAVFLYNFASIGMRVDVHD